MGAMTADEAYPLPDLPLWTSLAIVATYAVCTLCAIAIALWRAFYSPKARGGGSRRWPLRGLLYGLLITSFVSRVAEFSLSQLLADAAVRTAVLILNALGAAFNWASFTLVVCFIEEVRRSAQHSDPGATRMAVVWLRRATGLLVAAGTAAILATASDGAASYFAVAACECVTCGLYFVVAGLRLTQLRTLPGARRVVLTLGVLGVYLASRTVGLVLAALAVGRPDDEFHQPAFYFAYYAAEAVPSLLLVAANDIGAQVQLTSFNDVGVVPLGLVVETREVVLGPTLGEGSFGVVYSGTWRGRAVAVKQLKAAGLPSAVKQQLASELACEATLMSRLSHPHVVRFVGLSLEDDATPWVLTELCAGGSLHTLLLDGAQELGWELKMGLGRDLACGVAYLHGLTPPLIHRAPRCCQPTPSPAPAASHTTLLLHH